MTGKSWKAGSDWTTTEIKFTSYKTDWSGREPRITENVNKLWMWIRTKLN